MMHSHKFFRPLNTRFITAVGVALFAVEVEAQSPMDNATHRFAKSHHNVNSSTASRQRVDANVTAAALTGVVSDTASKPISGVEVSIPTLGLSARTDSAGRYRIADIAPGIHAVAVRHVGYAPQRVSMVFTDNETEEQSFVLRRLTTLAAVDVRDKRLDADEAEFELRKRAGIGTFLTRDKLSRFDETQLGRIIPQLPGARPISGRGNTMALASSRYSGRIGSAASARPCYAKIYIDNVLRYGGAPEEPVFDMNSVPVNEVQSIEYYAGGAQTPIQYSGLGASCGVLVIWMRKGGQPL